MPLGYGLIGVSDLMTRIGLDPSLRQAPFNNSHTYYRGSWSDYSLNRKVERFEIHPDALRFFKDYYEPRGSLDIPMLTVHAVRDPVVPLRHEVIYRYRVRRLGRGGNLRQVVVNTFGHGVFGIEAFLKSFGQLGAWVELDLRPEPPVIWISDPTAGGI
jgi:hypothetical protein